MFLLCFGLFKQQIKIFFFLSFFSKVTYVEDDGEQF